MHKTELSLINALEIAGKSNLFHLIKCNTFSYHALNGMKPDAKTIEQFKKLYLEEFGEELSDQEGFERFSRLLNFLRVLYFTATPRSVDTSERYDIVRTEK